MAPSYEIGKPSTISFNITSPLDSILEINFEPTTSVDDNLLVFPNPFSDYITIQSAKAKLKEIKLYDVNGKLIHQEIINSQSKKLPMENINSGVYILSTKTEEGSYVKKIISLK